MAVMVLIMGKTQMFHVLRFDFCQMPFQVTFISRKYICVHMHRKYLYALKLICIIKTYTLYVYTQCILIYLSMFEIFRCHLLKNLERKLSCINRE